MCWVVDRYVLKTQGYYVSQGESGLTGEHGAVNAEEIAGLMIAILPL